VEEFDGLGDRPDALLTWYFVSALSCIALRYTVPSVPFREIVRCSGPFRSVPFREIVSPEFPAQYYLFIYIAIGLYDQ